MRDIGYHFPDSDPRYKGIDSKVLLRNTMGMLADHGWHVVNVDTTICAERPKLSAYIPQMSAVLAEILDVEADAVGVKATTTERLGFTGREEGIAAYAVALLEK